MIDQVVKYGPDHKFIVYALLDPSDTIRYVGRSINGSRRPKDSLRRGWKQKSKCGRWLLGLKYAQQSASYVVLEECTTAADTNEAERYWIAAIKVCGATLLNMTDGAEGRLSYSMPYETRIKIGQKNSIALKGNKPWNKGIVGYTSPGTRAAGEKRRGRVQPLAERLGRAASLRGKKRPAAGLKIAAALLERGGRQVRCISNDVIYKSAGQAASACGLSRYFVAKSCRSGCTVGNNLRFTYDLG